MDTNDINRLLLNKKKFIGVFALDKLPKKTIKKPASLIINTDVSSKKGDHWVALVLTKNQAYYFDSFGLQIIDHQILSFLSQQKEATRLVLHGSNVFFSASSKSIFTGPFA